MKYARLTKEQLDELHQEFITFLATQSITGSEWSTMKEQKPEVAEEEIDIFSDLVWEGVLTKAKYLENIGPQQLFLFKVEEKVMKLIMIKITDLTKDINTATGYRWLQENFAGDSVEFFTSEKKFSGDKNSDIFSLIKQGASITKGELYGFFDNILNK